MTPLLQHLSQIPAHPLVHALGWTLLHFCWQGALVAAVLWCLLGLLGGRSSQARYGAACLALGLMVALPLATFAHVASAEYALRAQTWSAGVVIDPGIVLLVGADAPAEPWPARLAVALDRCVPWILLAWFAGIVVFVGRLNFGLMVARRLKNAETETPPSDLLQAFDALRIRLGIVRAVRLLHSARVQVPTVIGWLRPVVLIPASCLTGLSTEQIEAIFCHELAHVRRHDYLVSVFQSMVETLLFYHPAVWWVSKQVRRERECCCDAVAVGMGGDVLSYARALSYLEERRAAFPEVVLGANGGALKMRIQRLLGRKEATVDSPFAVVAALCLMVVVAGSYCITIARAQVKTPQVELVGATGQIAPARVPLASRILSPGGAGAPQSTAPQPAGAAQDTGWISGTVYDPHGALVPRANIKAVNTDTGMTMTKVTDNMGMFSLSVPTGPYNVEVQAAGFQRMLQENVHVEAGRTVGLNLKLSVGAASEHLTVTGKPIAAAPPPPPPPGVPPAKSSGPQRISSGVAQGLAIAQPQPVYPDEAKAQHIQGVVVLHARISKEGTVKDVQVISGPPALIVSSIDAVRQWKYKPYLVDGEPTEVETNININYTFAGSADSQAPTAAPEDGVSVPAGTMEGNLIYKVDPVYPEIAKQAHVQGVVVLHALISKTGTVEDLRIVSGAPMLTATAIDAVKQWKYKPCVLNGETVEVETTINVNFTLEPASKPNAPIPPGAAAAGKAQQGVASDAAPLARTVIFSLSAGPNIRSIEYKGLSSVTITEVAARFQRDNIGLRLETPYDPARITRAAASLKGLLAEHGRLNPIIRLETHPMPPNSIGIMFDVTEGPKSKAGTPSAAAASHPVAAFDPTELRRIGGEVSRPELIYKVDPEFTQEARKAKVSGIVLVNFVVDSKGLPQNVHVLKGVGHGLDAKAVEAVKQYKFIPAMESGKPVPVPLNVEVNFQVF